MCIGTKIHVSMETCEAPERMRSQPKVLILGLRGIRVFLHCGGLRDCWQPLTQACTSLFSSARFNYEDIQRPQTSVREKKIHACLHELISWNTLYLTLSFNQKTFDEPATPSPSPPHLWLPQSLSKVFHGNRWAHFLRDGRKCHEFYYTDYSWWFKYDPGQWLL